MKENVGEMPCSANGAGSPIHPYRGVIRGARKEYLVLDEEQAVAYKGFQPYVMVSVSSSRNNPPVFEPDPCRRGLLCLSFDDVSAVPRIPGSLIPFDVDMARQLIEFVGAHLDYVGRFVFHCEHGISRSAACALMVARYVGDIVQPFYEHYSPNPLVVNRLAWVMGEEPLKEFFEEE